MLVICLCTLSYYSSSSYCTVFVMWVICLCTLSYYKSSVLIKNFNKLHLSQLLASLISIGLHSFFLYVPSQGQSLIFLLMFRKLNFAFNSHLSDWPFFSGPHFCSPHFLGFLHNFFSTNQLFEPCLFSDRRKFLWSCRWYWWYFSLFI